MLRNSAEILDKTYNGILVKVDAPLEDVVDLSHCDVLHNHLAVGLDSRFSLSLLSGKRLVEVLNIPVRGRRKKIFVSHLSGTLVDHLFKLRNTLEHKLPALAKIVTLKGRKLDDLLYDHDVLRFNSAFT